MNSPSPLENIVLIGFMGCGKTSIGRELHQRLGYPLVDMDQEIEKRAGKAISEIFAEEGEAAFRDMETALLLELSQGNSPRQIISTGGGVVGRAENREILRQLGYVVWLQASVEVILERTGKNRARPLLQTANPEEQIRKLMEVREPLYAETANMRLDTAGLACSEVATGILECARYFFCHIEWQGEAP